MPFRAGGVRVRVRIRVRIHLEQFSRPEYDSLEGLGQLGLALGFKVRVRVRTRVINKIQDHGGGLGSGIDTKG